jgi:hypothetical protein
MSGPQQSILFVSRSKQLDNECVRAYFYQCVLHNNLSVGPLSSLSELYRDKFASAVQNIVRSSKGQRFKAFNPKS